MKRHNPKLPSKLLPALVGCALALSFGWAAAADKAAALKAAKNDPRSGALLNVIAAKAARAAGLAAGADGRVPQYIFHSAVNDPTADATAQDTQSETTVVDLGGGKLVSAYNDTGSCCVNNHLTGYAWSNNNGLSWTDAGKLPGSPGGDFGHPVLATHTASGSVYLATLGYFFEYIQVFKSTDAGHTFGAPVNANPAAVQGFELDRPWIADRKSVV